MRKAGDISKEDEMMGGGGVLVKEPPTMLPAPTLLLSVVTLPMRTRWRMMSKRLVLSANIEFSITLWFPFLQHIQLICGVGDSMYHKFVASH